MITKFYQQFKSDIELLFSSIKSEGSFAKNLSYLLSGKIVVVLLMVLTTPLLTRLYTPEEYGYFSFLNALATNFATFASLGYPFALVLAPSNLEFYNLMALCIALMTITCCIACGVLVLFSEQIIPFPITDNANAYLILLLLSFFIFSLANIIPRWNVWRNQFQEGASINVMVNVGSRVTSLGIGFLSGNPFGIIVGELTGKTLGLIVNFKINFIKEWYEIKKLVCKEEIILALKKYKNYPRYILTSNYLAGLIGQIPVFIFPFFFEAQILGSYSLALGLLNLPGLLIASPLSTVYTKKIANLQRENESQVPVFISRLFKGLVLIGIFPFGVLAVWSPELFTLVFGSQWKMAGVFAGILAFGGLFDFLQISIQSVMLVYKKEKQLFRLNLLQVALVIILFLPGILRNEPVEAIVGYAIARIIGSVLVIGKSLSTSGIKALPVLFKLSALLAVLFFVLKGIDILLK